jgi:hypothetical protein
VTSEVAWFFLAWYLFSRHVAAVPLLAALWRPVIAGMAMAACLMLAGQVQWMLRASLALAIYGLTLAVLGEPELRLKYAGGRPQRADAARAADVCKVLSSSHSSEGSGRATKRTW